MSAGQETSTDLVAVACVVEASLVIAAEWSRILIEYVFPLLRRLNELHPAHQFRLAFVVYGAADTRPQPLLSKRFFAPLSLITKELREEPSKLGIGQTNSGGGRGLSALEGLVAAIELFDILMASINSNHPQTQSPQKESRSWIFHILHIAGSPPDNVQKPQWNTLPHLDSVNWDAIPTELRKRKINLSLIGLRKIPQFQDLYSSVAGLGVQSPWFSVHAPHILLLTGFPAPQKGTKRQTDTLSTDQSPDIKRQKVAADPTSKPPSASPAPPPARIPQPQQPAPPQVAQVAQLPTAASGQNPSPAQAPQATISAPASTPTPSGTQSTSVLPLSAMDPEQMETSLGAKFGQMAERLKLLEKEIMVIDAKISNAQSAGQAVVLAALQKDRTAKNQFKDQIKFFLWQHYNKMGLSKGAQNMQSGTAGTAVPDGSAEAGPSTQPHPPNVSGGSGTVDEHKPVVPDSQPSQFWQSRGGTVPVANGGNPVAGSSQMQTMVSDVAAAQMHKLVEKNQPQNTGLAPQVPVPTSHDIGVLPSTANNQPVQVPNASIWNGTLSWTFPQPGGQAPIGMQIHMLGIIPSTAGVRTELWPNSLPLISCKEPVKDNAELASWLKRHQAHAMQFRSNPRAPDGPVNEQRFFALHKFMVERQIYAYTGWQLPSGKFSYFVFLFPVGQYFAGAVFPEGLSDLPGNNTLDPQPSTEEAKPQPSGGMNFSPTILARVQSLEPAKRQQVLQMLIQQEQIRRHQLQRAQQLHNTSTQAMMTMPTNQYGMTAGIPAGLHANGPNVGMYNTGGGTVNYEMLQSFMQRNAEGSTSQGMNLG